MNIPVPPRWFHRHGFEMSLGGQPISRIFNKKEVLICSKTAQFQVYGPDRHGKYKALWKIKFFQDEFAQGQILMSKAEIQDAFGISGKDRTQSALEAEFDADCLVQGRYIRKDQFLNIPCPGSGFDGDPNISIFVSDEIKEAVRKLFRKHS